MVKSKHILRDAQYPASISESRLEKEKTQKYLGSAKVALDQLCFERVEKRRQDDENTDRILSSFEQAGCLRLDRKYHVQAAINKDVLLRALQIAGSSTVALLSDDASQWPMLEFPRGFGLDCLHGQHRVAASMEYLCKSDRWWVVDFYSEGETVQSVFSRILKAAGRFIRRITNQSHNADIERTNSECRTDLFSHFTM